MKKPRLADTVALLLPSETQTSLLKACLLSGADCREAWRDWVAAVGDPKAFFVRETVGEKRLLSLLCESLSESEADIGEGFETHLRTAAFRDELRHERYSELFRAAAGALDHVGIDWIALRGAALAHSVYAKPSARHCHDIDLLIRPEQIASAARAVEQASFQLTSTAPIDGSYSVTLTHDSELPVQLHPRLYRVPGHQPAFDELLGRCVPASVCGTPATILCPEDALVHVCGHAMSSNNSRTLRWVCDAHMLVQSSPTLDWSAVIAGMQEARRALPISVAFGYLADRIGTAIPDDVLAKARELAFGASVADRDVTLQGVRLALDYASGAMWGESGLSSRLEMMRWWLIPSISYVRSTYRVTSPVSTALQYVLRPLRRIARLGRRASSRTSQLS